MHINDVVEELKRRGHTFGSPGMSNDGMALLNIDGQLRAYDEARRLLTDEVIHSASGRFRAEVYKGPAKWTARYFGPGEEDRVSRNISATKAA